MFNPLLMIDFYKATHHEQYPAGLTKMVSYYTPRMSRLKDTDKVTAVGIQGFCKEYLIDAFNQYFFNRPEEEVVNEYNHVLAYTLGAGTYEDQKIRDLHRLGYLPLEIRAVPEGTRTAIGVPQVEISNTHPNFVWLVNTIETLMSCTLWHMSVSAEVGYRYRQICQKYRDMTCEDTIPVHSMLGDFSLRGQHSVDAGIKSSASWLTSFSNTATVPAIMWLEQYYNCNVEKELVARGAISTEHSVMCSNFSVDGDEITQIKRLLTEIYPHNSFSMVSDSYDYWNLVTNILPQCRKEIMEHDGTLLVRGDSGDPVEVIAGKDMYYMSESEWEDLSEHTREWAKDWVWSEDIRDNTTIYIQHGPAYTLATLKLIPIWTSERGGITDRDYEYIDDVEFELTDNITPTAEIMGTVWALDQEFGHTVNSKGYKVLDKHIKAIYGDSITPQRCEEIYSRLTAKGYAVNNVVLGVGSFSFMCLETYDTTGKTVYNPYTRDTFGIAVKATYAEDENGNPIQIFKQPKALSWKKSQKGCCKVAADGASYTDCHTWAEVQKDTLMNTVFQDGKMVKETSLAEIRNVMYPEGF